ncbi:hypothetical protein QBC43DRAFT_363445 [Cladorrhinum sp. PSN259]|nr:hypothetical protein QBC43DRAFT_363445 [Cladorrhinum sp. PSN259]
MLKACALGWRPLHVVLHTQQDLEQELDLADRHQPHRRQTSSHVSMQKLLAFSRTVTWEGTVKRCFHPVRVDLQCMIDNDGFDLSNKNDVKTNAKGVYLCVTDNRRYALDRCRERSSIVLGQAHYLETRLRLPTSAGTKISSSACHGSLQEVTDLEDGLDGHP